MPPEKFGYLKKLSTAHQLARITDFITHGFNLKNTQALFY
jgi:hypothetical protein